jgi:acyl-CoA dehydrogenase
MDTHADLRASVRALCAPYGADYWREQDEKDGFPDRFLEAFTAAGFTAALIPESYGGSGLGLVEGTVILEEVHASGADGGVCHAAMNVMGPLLHCGGEALRVRWLPQVANGSVRFLAFAVTEADAGTDTSRIRTTARRVDDHYILNGSKLWISRALETDLMLVLARTSPRHADKRLYGLSILLVDMREARGSGVKVDRIATMVNHNSAEVVFENLKIPADHLIGDEGEGFRCIMQGMNAERILIGAECIGDARWFLDKAAEYARGRCVFGRPIGQNQAVQIPLAQAYARVCAARLVVEQAARLFDAGKPCGSEANMAKLLASQASWEAGDACLKTFGGMGFARELGVERKFRESRLYAVAPLSNDLALTYIAERELGLPKSF